MRRKRRSHRELFLAALSKLSSGGSGFVSNTALRAALEWDEERYMRLKKQLIDENVIIAGRGRGGAVALANVPGQALNVFVSYAHTDEAIKAELLKHMEPLRRNRLIEAWHDRKLKAGDEWDKGISDKLENADIILLLVSIDFINSSYCYDIELDKALELHETKKARVISVILRSCLWQYTPFAKLQALPKDARAVSAWDDQDEALADVAEGVRRVAIELLESR